MEQISNCIYLAAQIAKELQQNKEDISSCVGPRVADVYEAVTDNAIKTIRSVQYNLALLQQTSN